MGAEVRYEQAKTELEQLFHDAERSTRQGSSVEDFEPALRALLDFILDHPELSGVAESLFLASLTKAPIPHDLISYCMHSLRMDSVKAAAEQRIDPDNPRGWGPLSDILASFDDDWEDANMYEFYREDE